MILDKETFIDALKRLKPVIPDKSTIQVLTHVLIDPCVDKDTGAKTEYVRLMGTNLNNGLSIDIKGEWEDKAGICLPYKRLLEIVSELPTDDVTITIGEGHKAVITSGKAKFKISGIDPEDFPNFPDIEGEKIALDPALIGKVAYAVSGDDRRPNMCGAYLQSDEKISLVATDGHMLSWIDTGINGAGPGIIIPGEALKVLKSMEVEEVEYTHSFLKASTENTVYYSRLIEGDYVNFRRVIPGDENDKHVTIDRACLLEAVRRVAICAPELDKKIRLTVGADTVRVKSFTPEGSGDETLEAEVSGIDGEFGVSLNHEYTTKTLTYVSGGKVTLKFKDPVSAILVAGDESEDPEKPKHTTILMPIRETD